MHWVVENIAKFWLQYAMSLLAALIGLVYRRVLLIKKQAEDKKKEDEQQNKALCDAMKAIMRDRIRQSCKVHLKNGRVYSDDLDSLIELYGAYHALGGNSTTTEIVNRVKSLPIYIEEQH